MSDEQSPNQVAERSGRTLWHRLLGKFLELLLTPVAISVNRFGNMWPACGTSWPPEESP